jgi:hypothetical protein
MAMGQNNGNKPKLELALNESATVTLLRDKVITGTSAFGEYHLIPVEHNGVEKSLFASAELANEISTLKLGAGDTITIQKLPYQVGKKVVSRLVLIVPAKEETKKEPAGDNLKEILLQCVLDAAEVVKQSGLQFDLDATEKLSVALMIARTRAY